jgi:hypothetical protein
MQNKFVQLILASVLGAAIAITASALFRKGDLLIMQIPQRQPILLIKRALYLESLLKGLP